MRQKKSGRRPLSAAAVLIFICIVYMAFPAAASGEDHCLVVITREGDGVTVAEITHCYDHAEAAGQAAGLLENAGQDGEALLAAWQQCTELWTQCVNREYDALIEAAPEEEKETISKEQQHFLDLVNARKEMTAGLLAEDAAAAESIIAEAARKECVRLCYKLHAPAEEWPVSSEEASSEETDAHAKCAASFTLRPDGVTCREILCAAHRETERAARGMIDEGTDDISNISDMFAEAGYLWQTALDEITDPRYLEADDEERELIAKERSAFVTWLEARRSVLNLTRPERPDIVSEEVTQMIRDMVLEQCALG